MIEYTVLKVFWWFILGGVLVIYAATAGYDVGVTTFMSFFSEERDRRLILNTSAPTWDGNLTWIVFAGGGIFVVWPVIYATAFSGLFAAMLLILFPLFLRPPGYEYRNKLPSLKWKRLCDWGLFISGIVPVFIFGVATGNCFVGFPFHFDPISLRIFYTGSFVDLLNPLGILAGVLSVTMVLLHGSTFLQRRTRGHIHEFARRMTYYTGSALLVLLTFSGVLIIFYSPGYILVSQPELPTANILGNVVDVKVGAWFQSYFQYPWKFYPPFVAFGGIILAMLGTYFRKQSLPFWSSAFAVAGIIGTAGFTLFPFVMPSSTDPNQSLTVWNATSSHYALNMMFYVGTVMFIIVFAYKMFAFSSLWGQNPVLTHEDIEKDTHTYY